MNIHVLRTVLGLSLTQMAVLKEIHDLSTGENSTGWCFKSKESIAATLDVSKRTITSIIDDLSVKTFIVKHYEFKSLRLSAFMADIANENFYQKHIKTSGYKEGSIKIIDDIILVCESQGKNFPMCAEIALRGKKLRREKIALGEGKNCAPHRAISAHKNIHRDKHIEKQEKIKNNKEQPEEKLPTPAACNFPPTPKPRVNELKIIPRDEKSRIWWESKILLLRSGELNGSVDHHFVEEPVSFLVNGKNYTLLPLAAVNENYNYNHQVCDELYHESEVFAAYHKFVTGYCYYDKSNKSRKEEE